MKFKNLNEDEKLFIVKVTNLENKSTYYVRTLNSSSEFISLTSDASEALPVTKEQWECCYLREVLSKKTYRKSLSWGSEDKQKYRCTLTKYIPNVKDLIPVFVQVTNKNFGLTDVKNYFKKADVKILMTEKGRYTDRYSDKFISYDILYINEMDLETVEDLVKTLKSQIDIGFAEPDRNTSACDKLTYK